MTKAKATQSKGKTEKPHGNKKCGKCRKLKKNCNCGRNLFDGKDEALVLSKLEEAFTWGATDNQACIHADISPAALYRYEEKNPHFRERKHTLKESPQLRAKKTIYTQIETDAAMAFRLLERKERGEYAPHSTFSGELTAPTLDQDEDEDAIAEAVNQWQTRPDEVIIDGEL